MTFDPNVKGDPPDHLWGTYRPHCYGKNRTAWKTHRTLAQCRSAVDSRGYDEITVYRRSSKSDRWESVAAFDRKNDPAVVNSYVCFVCGAVFVRTPGDSGRTIGIRDKWHPDEFFTKVRVHYNCASKVKGAPPWPL